MKALTPTLAVVLLVTVASWAGPRAGFYLPDSIQEMRIKYKTVDGLILLPVTINNNIRVNLILDTGCRNLILFGKRFEKLFSLYPGKKVEFSGLGDGRAISGGLSINNTVAIAAVLGEQIPIVIIKDRNLFSQYPQVDGVIGYEVFSRFEIELNPKRNDITFRPGGTSELPADYSRISLRIEDSRPILAGVVEFADGKTEKLDLMIDTGSTLGLLVKTERKDVKNNIVVGRGLNGLLSGERKKNNFLLLESLRLEVPFADVVSSWNNYSTLGMDVLKEYSLILNYSRSYAGLKRIDS